MTAITGLTSSIGAYQREASRDLGGTLPVAAKVVTRDAGLSLGPFSLTYTATDYEFDLGDAGGLAAGTFADALDAASQRQALGESMAATTDGDAAPNALTRRQALAGYQACLRRPATATAATMFTATV